MPLIPEKLVNFRVYAGVASLELIGLADVELPNFEAMSETIMGAGIAGEFDSPVIGHFKAMAVKLKFRSVTALAMGLLAPVDHVLDVRGSVQVRDSSLGALVTQAWRIEVRGPAKGLNPGKLEPGKPTDAECSIEVARIAVSLAGLPLVELDKFNSVFKVNGVDYLRGVRVDLGGV